MAMHATKPGNNIEVYLEPLIDYLKSLWDGIRGVYDAHIGEYFTLKGVLLWTINDFPTYGSLSGCVVKGYKACPICGDDTPSQRLKNGHKICYTGHRKWLPINHPYRRQRAAFDRKLEYGTPPEPLTGEEVLHMVEDINYIQGSKNGENVRENDGDKVCWKKKSKFFDLKYLKYLHVRHVLDVVHIEKNVCNSIISTLLEIPGKNKDGIVTWLYLLNMGVKTDLQPEYGERCTRLPPGPWNLSKAEKRAVCNSFYGIKVPEDSRLLGLKSHDCHTLKQQLLPMAIRSVLEKPASIVRVPSSQKMGVSKPLSGCTVSLVDRNLLNQAHLFVLENTEEVLPYIEYVESELNGEENNGVSENLKWLAAGPSMAVPSYMSYLVNGVKLNTKAQDDVRTVQNSGVYLLAHTMQVASAKDKNPIVSNMGFYGVIQEIWDLDYQKFRIPVLRCNWIDNTSGLIVDELGFTLVDPSKIGHRNDQFVMASQVKQVFYVDDPMHRG
ncbi:unnamed protein product [Prunus armeniaca]